MPWFVCWGILSNLQAFYLQKIFNDDALPVRSLIWYILLLTSVLIIFRCCLKYIKEPFTRVTDLQYTGHIATTIAVIRSAPDGAQSVVIQYLISFLTELVSPQDVRHRIYVEKFPDDLGTKCVTCSPWAKAELISIWIWIAPDQVRHRPLVGYLSEAINDLDLIQAMNAWAQASVDAEDVIIDDDTECKEIEHVSKVMPNICVSIFPVAFSIKSIRLGHTS